MSESESVVVDDVSNGPCSVLGVGTAPRIGGSIKGCYWVGGSNLTANKLVRPRSTLAWRPDDYKSAARVEEQCQKGLPIERQLSEDGKASKITLTSWITSLRVNLEERGLDTVFRIINNTTGAETYLLEKWGESKNEEMIETWVKNLREGLPTSAGPCTFDEDNLIWSGKAVLNSISLDMWESIEKSLPPYPSGPEVFGAVIRKKQYLNASSVRKMVDQLQGMKLISEPGQNVNTFANKILELANRIEGSGGAPADLALIVAGTFLGGTVQAFELKVLGLHDRLDEDPACLDIKTMVKRLQSKYDSLVTLDMWTPKNDRKANEDNELAALTATVSNLVQKLTTRSDQPGNTSEVIEADAQQTNNASGGGGTTTKSWKRIAPKQGETESKTLEGILYKWCGKCKRWTSGDKYLHSTSEHKSKKELADKSLNLGARTEHSEEDSQSLNLGVRTEHSEEDSPAINSGGLQMHSLFTGHLIHNSQPESREHLIDRLYPDVNMEEDNYVKDPPGVSSAKLTICGVDDQIEGDENTEFLPDIKAVTHATDMPNEGDNYVKNPPGINAATNNVTNVQDKIMEGDNYVKKLPGVGTVAMNVTNVKNKPMGGDSYVKDPPGVNAVSNPIKPEYNVDSFHDTMCWLNSYIQNVTPSHGFPYALFLLSYIMLDMNYIGNLLSSAGRRWVDTINCFFWYIGIKKTKSYRTRMKESRDKILNHIQKILNYIQNFSMTGKETSRGSDDDKENSNASKKAMLIGLTMFIVTIISNVDIRLTKDSSLSSTLLKKTDANGLLLTGSLENSECAQIRKALETLPSTLTLHKDVKPIIIDTGCSVTASGFLEDFEPNTLKIASESLTGIGGKLKASKEGIMRFEVITEKGDVVTVRTRGMYLPDLHCRLFSPQAYFKEHNNPDIYAKFNHKGIEFSLGNGNIVSTCYHELTHLPVIAGFTSALTTAKLMSMSGWVTDEHNRNLIMLQKYLLRWHHRLGHLGFQHLQWIGRKQWLGKLGEKIGKCNNPAPQCASCQFGIQDRTPKGGKKTVINKERSGVLKRDKLRPGQLVFTDQYESRIGGRVFSQRGYNVSTFKYKGGTLFCDAASQKIFVHHQVTLTAQETIESKLKFEKEALID